MCVCLFCVHNFVYNIAFVVNVYTHTRTSLSAPGPLVARTRSAIAKIVACHTVLRGQQIHTHTHAHKHCTCTVTIFYWPIFDDNVAHNTHSYALERIAVALHYPFNYWCIKRCMCACTRRSRVDSRRGGGGDGGGVALMDLVVGVVGVWRTRINGR